MRRVAVWRGGVRVLRWGREGSCLLVPDLPVPEGLAADLRVEVRVGLWEGGVGRGGALGGKLCGGTSQISAGDA